MRKKLAVLMMLCILTAIFGSVSKPILAAEQPATAEEATVVQSLSLTQKTEAAQKTADATNITTIKVGALLSITGSWSASGIAAEQTLKNGLVYVNEYLKEKGVQIVLDIRDTQSKSEKALEELKSLHNDGINTVIGPMSSEEAVNLLQYSNDNSILLISPAATSAQLALKDNFFRTVASDSSQVKGLTTIINTKYEKKNIICAYMDDAYGKGYYDLLKKLAASDTMNIIGAVPISASNPDYSAVAASLKDYAASANVDETAVVLISTAQMASEVIEQVAQNEKLSSMKWFASADIIGNQDILKDTQTASFLLKTGMEGLTFSYRDIALDALPYIGSILNGAADTSPFAIMTWDALWLLANTYGVDPDADFASLKENLVNCAANYRNAFGSFSVMDENGDMKGARYMRYVCTQEKGSIKWSCMGHYVDLGSGNPILQTIKWQIAPDSGYVVIGALLPLSGDHSEKGKETKKILNYAVSEFNKYAQSCGSEIRLSLVVEDTKSNPEVAEQAAKKLVNLGIQNIIGPINSSELEQVKLVIDEAGIIDISPLTTATSLSVADRIYRPTLNDSVQVKALNELLKQDGISKLVVINSDDNYGNEMVSLIKSAFVGEVVDYSYSPNETDYSSVLSKAEQAVAGSDAAKTAVLTVSYDEIVPMMKLVSKDSSLRKVRWYGTDSSALSNALVSDSKAAKMAADVNYTTLDFSPYGINFDPLYYVINSKLKSSEPIRESLISSFDSLWLLGCAYLINGSTADLGTINKYVASNAFRGAGGVFKLDANGDRQFGYFKFYKMTADQNDFTWDNIGVYSQDMLNPGVLKMFK